MNQPWTKLRRAMLAFAFIGTLGFGASQAIAVPTQARNPSCSWGSGPTFDDYCYQMCVDAGFDFGYCENGGCQCTEFGNS